MRVRIALALAAIAFLALLAWDRAAEPVAVGASRGGAAASRPESRPGSAEARAVSALPQPVPAATGVVSTTVTASANRAEHVAACQRAMALLACKRQRSQLYYARRARHYTLPDIDPECGALQDDPKAWRPVFEAARRGHVPSMARFADGSLLPLGRVDEEWDLEAMAFYRDYGFQFLTRAAAAGDGGAIVKLAREMTTPAYGPGAIPYDPVRGLAYAKVLLRHADRDWRGQLENQMGASLLRFTPLEWARAETLSREILSPEGELALEGWSPLRTRKDAGYGCDL